MYAEFIGVFPFVCPLDNGYNNTCALKYRGFLSCAFVTVAIHVSRNRGWRWGRFVCLWNSVYTCAPQYRVVFFRVPMGQWTYMYSETSGYPEVSGPPHPTLTPLSFACWTGDIHFSFVCLWDSRYTCALKCHGFSFRLPISHSGQTPTTSGGRG